MFKKFLNIQRIIIHLPYLSTPSLIIFSAPSYIFDLLVRFPTYMFEVLSTMLVMKIRNWLLIQMLHGNTNILLCCYSILGWMKIILNDTMFVPEFISEIKWEFARSTVLTCIKKYSEHTSREKSNISSVVTANGQVFSFLAVC